MMKVSEVTKVLLDGIEPAFQEHQFKLNKKKKQFKRGNENITQIFELFFYKQSDDLITIKPQVRLRVEPIEKIYRSITDFRVRPYSTLGNHLFEIIRYMDTGEETGKRNIHDWSVQGRDDLDKLIEVIPEYLIETILPYFEENSSVARVDCLLNKYPRELSIHHYLYPERANLAIIAAKLNNNPRYTELLDLYEEELREAAEDYKSEFEKIRLLLSESQFSSDVLQ